jgi:hypothetical protein
MLSRPFHVNVHAGTAQAGARPSGAVFARSFEEVAGALAALPRMFVEPDGSFVWVASGEPTWQLDGVLYDGAAGLWYVELKGCCPESRFDELLRGLGWPEAPVMFQLVREAVTLSEDDFRRHAGWSR